MNENLFWLAPCLRQLDPHVIATQLLFEEIAGIRYAEAIAIALRGRQKTRWLVLVPCVCNSNSMISAITQHLQRKAVLAFRGWPKHPKRPFRSYQTSSK